MKKRLKLFGVKESLGLAGTSVALGTIGGAVGSESISKAGGTAASYVPVAVNVGMGATVINMAKNLKKIRR